MQVPVVQRVLSANDEAAMQNRHRFDATGLRVVNVMASPGAGKTTLLVRTAEALKEHHRIAVIEGDLASRIDADRVAAVGVPALQINTGGGCHLDATMIADVLPRLDLEALDLLLIENVGNLVCPTHFALGEHRRVLVASVPEGDDKPLKYPGSFLHMDAIVLNKTDLIPYVEFSEEAFQRGVRAVNREAPIFPLSCRTGAGLAAWLSWLEQA